MCICQIIAYSLKTFLFATCVIFNHASFNSWVSRWFPLKCINTYFLLKYIHISDFFFLHHFLRFRELEFLAQRISTFKSAHWWDRQSVLFPLYQQAKKLWHVTGLWASRLRSLRLPIASTGCLSTAHSLPGGQYNWPLVALQ